jgi:hypothetical protein
LTERVLIAAAPGDIAARRWVSLPSRNGRSSELFDDLFEQAVEGLWIRHHHQMPNS